MELLDSISLREYEPYITREVLAQKIPVKLLVNGNTGEAWIYDPTDPTYRYAFQLPVTAPLKGRYVSLRTNSVAASFGLE